jgi:hypothetical protein
MDQIPVALAHPPTGDFIDLSLRASTQKFFIAPGRTLRASASDPQSAGRLAGLSLAKARLSLKL